MKKQISPIFAFMAIVSVLVIIGFFFWKANEDKPIPEGPGGGRIGQTMNLGKPKAKPDAASASKAGKPSSGDAKTTEAKPDEDKSKH